jgi:hypothetical protein
LSGHFDNVPSTNPGASPDLEITPRMKNEIMKATITKPKMIKPIFICCLLGEGKKLMARGAWFLAISNELTAKGEQRVIKAVST